MACRAGPCGAGVLETAKDPCPRRARAAVGLSMRSAPAATAHRYGRSGPIVLPSGPQDDGGEGEVGSLSLLALPLCWANGRERGATVRTPAASTTTAGRISRTASASSHSAMTRVDSSWVSHLQLRPHRGQLLPRDTEAAQLSAYERIRVPVRRSPRPSARVPGSDPSRRRPGRSHSAAPAVGVGPVLGSAWDITHSETCGPEGWKTGNGACSRAVPTLGLNGLPVRGRLG